MTKIIDIIPPRDKSKKDGVLIHKQSKPKKSFKALKIAVFTLLIFVIAGVFVYCMDGNADVTVYPITKQVGLEEIITISAIEASIDTEDNIIPAEYFEDTVEFTAYYDATGSDDSGQIAEGIITVFSEYAKEVNITANTRFLTSDGLLFRSREAFVIPANGEIDVEVYATKAGEDYNLKNAVFAIPGLAECCQAIYGSVYAEVKEGTEISGGKSSVVKVVLEEDIEDAEDNFKEKYLEQAKNQLITNINKAGSYIFSEEDVEQEFEQFIINASAGDVPETEKFEVMGIIKTKILAIREADIDNFIEEKLELSEQGLELVPESLEKEFSLNDDDETVLIANAYTYPQLNKIFLLNDIKGLELSDGRSLLEAMEEIRSADVSASLFWKNTLPSNRDNINLTVNFQLLEE
jgi:hypothetical protein